MHAVIVTVELDEAVAGNAEEMLNQQVIPAVKAAPGFVAGSWLERGDGKGLSVVLFESEETARAAAPPVGLNPSPGVIVGSVDIRAVAASA
jgi:hypothetical protein